MRPPLPALPRPGFPLQTLLTSDNVRFSSVSATPITDSASLRHKEAVYTAAGRLVRFVVQNDNIPAEKLLKALADECQIQRPEYRCLKRRIGWLIGE